MRIFLYNTLSCKAVASNQIVNQPSVSILVSPLSSTSLGESSNPIGSNFASSQSINDFITRDFMSDLSDDNEKKSRYMFKFIQI